MNSTLGTVDGVIKSLFKSTLMTQNDANYVQFRLKLHYNYFISFIKIENE